MQSIWTGLIVTYESDRNLALSLWFQNFKTDRNFETCLATLWILVVTYSILQHSASESFLDNDRLTPHNSQPIRAANSRIAQQTIISMEDDDISDQEMVHSDLKIYAVYWKEPFQDQAEDHGYFKSLSRLWEHLPHLAVFMNYILSSNSDPNSLLFYLLTDLYKEGNAKEMRKWAFEIHSCFLVPGAVSCPPNDSIIDSI